jgi:hypothetical protein
MGKRNIFPPPHAGATKMLNVNNSVYVLLTAETEQVRKIHNMSFRHLGIFLLQNNTKMAKTRVMNFSDLFPFCS